MDHTLIQLRQTVRRSRVFNLIQQNNEQLSRFDICKLTRYSTTTVTAIVDGLVEEGEPVAMDIFSETCEYICRMLETLFSFFRPDVAVLSTYLNDQQQLLEQRIWKHLAQWDPEFHPNLVFIPPANELASFGAAVAGYDAVFPVPTSEP